MKKRYKKGELAKEILKTVAIGGLLVCCVAMPGLAYVFTLFKPKNSYEKRRLKQSVKSLQHQKFIRIYSKGNKDFIEITKKGQKKLLEYELDKIKIKKPKKWDGLWRVVIFDIPENKKRIRDEINFRLKDMGFISIQKSTFISPFECKDEIDFIGEYFIVRNNIIYFLVKDIDNQEKLKKKFNLSNPITCS